MTAPSSPQLDVEFETNEIQGGDLELIVRVPPEQVKPIREQIISTFARRVNIPGFRKGRAPRAIIERHLDAEALKQEITEHLLEGAYDAALEKAGIKALGRARISDSAIADDGAFTFKATLSRRPEITLGDYQGLKATRHLTRVTEAEVDRELERLRSRYAKFVEVPPEGVIEKGDLVIVDYEGFVDGERVEQACASGYPLEVGVDELFPELNEALLGGRVGETKEITTASAPEHFGPQYAGKPVIYKVKAASARRREFPPLDDAFAKQVSDLETLEALRKRIHENLEVIGRAVADDGVRSDLTRQVCEGASLEMPPAFVGRAVDRRVAEIEEEVQRRGMSLAQHLSRLNRSFDDWRADLEIEVRDDVRRALVLDEIGTRESIEVTDEEIEAETARIAEQEHTTPEKVHEQLHQPEAFNRMATRLYHRKIVQFLVDHAEIAEEVVEPSIEEGSTGSSGVAQEPTDPVEER